MIPVFFSELFSNLDEINSIFATGKNIKDGKVKGSRVVFDIDYEMMTNPQRLVFGDLFDSLGITNDSGLKRPEVYATASYDLDTYERTFISSPVVVLNHNREMVLQIGTIEKGLEIPIVYYDAEEAYYLSPKGGTRIKIELISVKTNSKDILFFSVKEAKRPSYVFNFNIRLCDNTNTLDLREAFYNGTFDRYVSRSGYDGISLTKAFAVCFENGTFPDTGVLLTLLRGKQSTYHDVENDKNYVSSKWEILSTSHPNLLVTSYTNGLIPLSDVVYISCGSSASASRHLQNIIDLTNDVNTEIDVYYLYLSGANYQGNKIRLDWQPKNIGFSGIKYFSPLVKRNFNEYIKGVEISQQKNLPKEVINPTDLADFDSGVVEVEVVKDEVEAPKTKSKKWRLSSDMDTAAALDVNDLDNIPLF